MTDNQKIALGLGIYTLGQTVIWFQANGQFIWKSFKDNPFIVALIGGTAVSYFFILATGYLATAFNGLVWPGRFLGFAVGMVIFATLTHYILGEPFTIKTAISLTLCIVLILIQLFL